MAQINGSKVLVWLKSDGTTPTVGDVLLFTTNATLSITHDTPDATTKDSAGWAENISGLRSWEITVDGLTDFSGGTNTDVLWQLINTRETTAEIVFAVDGSSFYTGNVTVSGLEFTNDMETASSFSGTLVGNGVLTKTP